MTRVMEPPAPASCGVSRIRDDRAEMPGTNQRRKLLIEILMGGHAPPNDWIETLLDRIEARP